MKFHDIPTLPGFEITRSGIIRNKKTLKIKSQYIGSTGYYMISVSVSNKSKPKRVHRLLAQTFKKNPLNLPEVNHEDGNKLNNALPNLKWTDHLGNMQHAFKTGLANNTGIRNGRSKLTEDQVRVIKRLLADGVSQYKIAEQIGGISRSAVMNIKNRGQWAHVTI
jgi:hypothetical protein